ncbi:MAG: VWA domain-containing protein [Chloroflexota bacterium]|nr:MAG: VWA domain-containing protein [Chloroflexota bacterium]
MDFLWTESLLLLGLIPLIVAVYIWILRRRRRFAVRYSSLALVREAVQHQSRLRRHLPFALFLAALASLVVAMGRPVSFIDVPIGQSTIILTIDVSRSMCSVDIPPNRLQAAQDAALSFIRRQGPNTQIGIVAFAGFAVIVQPPTTDQQALQTAVESLTTARRTAIGSGILKAIDAIAEVNKNVAPSVEDMTFGIQPTPVPADTYVPDIIVLLTDGASNSGPMPLDAAQQAADRGVRVYTIGFGTDDGLFMDCGDQLQGEGFFGGGGGGSQPGTDQFGGFRRGIDEATLKQIAALTGAEYYSATSANELNKVFEQMPTYLITRQETTEISFLFTTIGALLATLAIALAMLWHPLT